MTIRRFGKIQPALWILAAGVIGLASAPAQDPSATSQATAASQPGSLPASQPTHAAASTSRVLAQTPQEGYQIAVVPITDMIHDVTNKSMRERIERAIEEGATLIVLEIDTFGGMVTSALEICEYLKNMTVPTVAWVRPKAISAGAMISVACDEIVVSRASRFGDCAPIAAMPGGGAETLGETERSKAESPILQEFRDSARRNGYDLLLSEKMVRLGEAVYWVEHSETGERRFVEKEEKERLFGETKSSVLPKLLQLAKPETSWRLVESYFDPVIGEDQKVIQPILGDKQLLTISQSEAVAYGFAKAVVADEAGLVARYSSTESVVRFDATWSDRLAHYLAHPAVRSVLFLMMLVAAYSEMKAPGLGMGGLVAILCLAVFLGAPYLTGLANVWEIILVAMGIALLLVEIFVIPGFGLAGIAGFVLIFAGLLASYVPEEPGNWPLFHWPTLPMTWDGLQNGLQSMAAGMVMSLVGMYFLAKYLPGSMVMARIAPANPTRESVTVDDPYEGVAMVGDIGTAEVPLRPSGKGWFGTTLVDVVSEGEYIKAGQAIEVIKRHGNRVVVRAVQG
jgi:membrane-bound serine protease (ClpP class)